MCDATSVNPTTFRTQDGLLLFRRDWPHSSPRAIVLVVHGGGEHSGRYEVVANRLNGAGYSVVSYDARGHGHSPGRRLFVRSFWQYVADLDSLVQVTRQSYPNAPLFVLGHSMGGTVVAGWLLQEPPPCAPNGVIFSGPLLKIGTGFSRWKVWFAKFCGRLVPYLPVDRTNPHFISRDPEVVRKYQADTLVYHGSIPAGTAAAALSMLGFIESRCDRITVPVLLLHGTADQLADLAGSQMLVQRAASTDKQLRTYAGLFHEIFQEPERQLVLDDLVKWLDVRTTSPEEVTRMMVGLR